mmetsp:Transcript_14525/g.39143  ORF Transcript_14525/g.39143 Transcript_14525/m.39143 type:complete len:227 (+) Transcript_14525:768-1448(+)
MRTSTYTGKLGRQRSATQWIQWAYPSSTRALARSSARFSSLSLGLLCSAFSSSSCGAQSPWDLSAGSSLSLWHWPRLVQCRAAPQSRATARRMVKRPGSNASWARPTGKGKYRRAAMLRLLSSHGCAYRLSPRRLRERHREWCDVQRTRAQRGFHPIITSRQICSHVSVPRNTMFLPGWVMVAWTSLVRRGIEIDRPELAPSPRLGPTRHTAAGRRTSRQQSADAG